MRKLLYILMLAVIGLTACVSNTKSTEQNKKSIPVDSLVQAYDDDLFSLLLPQGWTFETDTVETTGVKHIVDSLGIISGIVEFYPPNHSFKIRLVKSAMRWMAPNNPSYDWAELAQMNASRDSICIYLSEITDSIKIDGHDACCHWMAFDLDGDTIIQDQYVVIKDKYDLYYINGIYDYGDNKSSNLFQKILSTIKLK